MLRPAAIAVLSTLAQVTAAQAGEPAPGSLTALMAAFEMRGTIGSSVGFDSNPDEVRDAEGSAYGRLDATVGMSVGEDDGMRGSIDLEGTGIRYAEEAFADDYEYRVAVEGAVPLNDKLTAALTAYRYADGTDDPPTVEQEIGVGLEGTDERAAWTLRGWVYEYREEISDADIEADDLERYDYRTYSGEAKVTASVDWPVKPVIGLRLTRLDYLERRPGKPDRDAVEYSALLGGEIALADRLTARVGLRRNERFFDSDDDSHDNFGPDVTLEWKPNEKLAVEVSVERGFEEPAEEDDLLRDRLSSRIAVAYEASERLSLSGGLGASRSADVTSDYRSTELEATGEARWQMRKHLAVKVEAAAAREIRHDDSSQSYSRAGIRAGLEASL